MSDWESFLTERRLAVVATTGPDGTPHAVPVEVVVDGGAAFVWCGARSVKARNAARSGRAALVAYKGMSFALVRGAAEVFGAERTEYERLTELFLSKYDRTERYGNDALIKIVPERVSMRNYDD